MMQTRFASKYKDTITDMNREYRNLLTAFKFCDTQVMYLYTFELALEQNCDFQLCENPRYLRVTSKYPLPEKGYVPLSKFRLYMMLYSYIMRDAGLLNREVEAHQQDGVIRHDYFGGSG